jgi:hypothetical protein
MTRPLLLAAAGLLLNGCYAVRFTTGDAMPYTEPHVERWHHGVASGIVEISDPVQLASACPKGFRAVENVTSPANWLVSTAASMAVSAVTAGLGTLVTPYQPRTVRVWCSDGRKADIGSGPDGSLLADHDVE